MEASLDVSARKGKTATTTRVRRPQQELEAALRRRHRFLSASATAYDAGDAEEAFRMVVDLRALLHYGSSAPLLHELGLIKKIDFVDSCPHRERPPGAVLAWGGGLTIYRSGVDSDGVAVGKVVPRLDTGDETFTLRKYTPWWKSDLVVTAENGKRHSRRFLVTQMGNTDAAHTDAYLDGDYQALQPRDSTWFAVGTDGVARPGESDVAGASVRQITWEVLRTLETQCAGLL